MRGAQEHKIDLILLGPRGRGMFERWLLGSISRSVIAYAECAVMVVRWGVAQAERPVRTVAGRSPAVPASRCDGRWGNTCPICGTGPSQAIGRARGERPTLTATDGYHSVQYGQVLMSDLGADTAPGVVPAAVPFVEERR